MNVKLLKLKRTVKIERNPFLITRQTLKLFRIGCNTLLALMIFYYWSTIPLLLPRVIVLAFLLGTIFLANKGCIIVEKRIGKTLFIRERLWYMMESLNLYDSKGNRVINTAILTFSISDDDVVTISAPLFGDKWTKQLKNLEDNLVAGLGLPLLSKKELLDCVIYQLGHIEEIEQYVFKNNLTRKFFQNISSPVIKLSNAQQFSLKSNTNIGVYGRTGTGKTIAL